MLVIGEHAANRSLSSHDRRRHSVARGDELDNVVVRLEADRTAGGEVVFGVGVRRDAPYDLVLAAIEAQRRLNEPGREEHQCASP